MARTINGSINGTPAGASSIPGPAADPDCGPGPGPSPRDAALLRRAELSAFLRSRRERITPDQVGLPEYGRRRTPGLRREEVAQLAGVGVTWYTWLEQGRDIHPSPQVLDAVARTLMLDGQERAHLFTLSGHAPSTVESECSAVPGRVRTIIDGVLPYPASVVNAKRDVLAYNLMYDAIVGPLDHLPAEDRNLLWQVFTNPRTRRLLVDWEEASSRMVAQFRGAMAEHVGDPSWKRLLQRLLATSPEFAAMWERHDVEASENLTKRLLTDQVGLLRLDYTSLWLGPRSGVRIVTYTPADEQTRVRLDRLYQLTIGAAKAS